MLKLALLFKLAVLATLFALSLAAQADSNHPTTPADLERIEYLQRRVDKLAFGPLGPNGYTLSKARAWLDMALIEYHQRQRSGIVQDAIAQATRLTDELRDNPMFISLDTPLPEASEKVRSDLWDKAEALKKRGNLTCNGRKIAELEVQLIWTGHYKQAFGWSVAEPYARMAENLAYEAQFEFDPAPCTVFVKPAAPFVAKATKPIVVKPAAPVAIKLVAPARPTIPMPVVAKLPVATVPLIAAPASTSSKPPASSKPTTIEKHTLSADMLFAFGQARLSDDFMRHGGLQDMDKIVLQLQLWKSLQSVQLIGHTDRLGKDHNNRRISLQRTEQIKSYLIKRGIPARVIETKGMGASQPLVKCPDQRDRRALVKCLQPNRRVEIIIGGVRK